MNIYIDIISCEIPNGKRIAYCPKVHWELDDKDTFDKDTMDKMASEIQQVADKWLRKTPDQIEREQSKDFCEGIFKKYNGGNLAWLAK